MSQPLQNSTSGDVGEYILFKGQKDRYHGISVSSKDEPRSEEEFAKCLEYSINNWKQDQARAIWMTVYLQHSFWIPVLILHGFTYHHAKTLCVTMVKWLPETEPNNIPSFAHNTVGVGAFVVNDSEELLVVREKFFNMPHWKLPGGYVEQGENLGVAAIREVKEETGIETEFGSLLAFRHMHKLNYGCSDLYFIVHLKPTSQRITMCTNELEDCRWMKLSEYLSHPDVHETNKFFAKCYLDGKENGVQISALNNKLQIQNFSRDQVLYFMESKNNLLVNSHSIDVSDDPHVDKKQEPTSNL